MTWGIDIESVPRILLVVSTCPFVEVCELHHQIERAVVRKFFTKILEVPSDLLRPCEKERDKFLRFLVLYENKAVLSEGVDFVAVRVGCVHDKRIDGLAYVVGEFTPPVHPVVFKVERLDRILDIRRLFQ